MSVDDLIKEEKRLDVINTIRGLQEKVMAIKQLMNSELEEISNRIRELKELFQEDY